MATAKKPAPPAPKAPARPAPPKPTPPKPVAAKPGPPKPAAAAPKAPPSNGKPAAPKVPTAAKPAAPAGNYVTVEAFEAFQASVAEVLEAHSARMDKIQVDMTGFGQYVSMGEDGAYVLDIENADRATLRDWCHAFGFAELLGEETETIRETLTKKRNAKGFKGWDVVATGAAPAEEEGGEEAPAAEAAEGEEDSITEEAINSMNWAGLAELATRCGIDYSDIKPPQPKVLRARIIEALSGGGEEAPAEAGEEEGATLVEGETHVIVTHENEEYPAVFAGVDEDGNYLVTWDADGSQGAVPPDSLSLG